MWVAPVSSSSPQTPSPQQPSYRFIGPDLAAQGESFTGIVVEQTEKGYVPLKEGEQVSVQGVTVNVGRQGTIICPPFNNPGNFFFDVQITQARTTPQAQPGQTTVTQHMEVVKVPPNAPTKIARTPNVVTPGARFNVEGQGLKSLQRAALVSDDGKQVDLPESVGSSLQRVYSAPPDLPKGNFRFVASDAQGNRYQAPEQSRNPTFRLSGDTVKQRGQRGQVTILSDTTTTVVLSGGEPQIKLDQTLLEVRANQPVKAGFTANEVGPYTIRASAVNNEDLMPASDAPKVDAKPEPIETHYDPNRNMTESRATVRVIDDRGQPMANVPVDMALSHPNGVEYARVTTDQRGRASFLHTFVGRMTAEELVAHIFRVLGYRWKPPPTPTQSPIPTTTERPTQSPSPIPTTTAMPVPSPSRTEQPTPLPTQTQSPTPFPMTTTLPTQTPTPTPSPTPYPSPSPSPRPRQCVLETQEIGNLGIGVDVVSPAAGTTFSKFNETIPLIVNAADGDLEDQSCFCPPGTPEHKMIEIVDSVTYAWTPLGGGGALDAGGPATLYQPPEIPIGGKITAIIQVEIKDSRGNDNAAKVTFTITIERTEDCKYKRDVAIAKETDAGSTPLFTGGNECKPGAATFTPPVPLTGNADDILKVCVGQRVVVRASGSDHDTLELQCASPACGSPHKTLELIDEMKYTWTASIGGFPDHGGAAVTNSNSTSAIYKAPDTPGEGTIDVVIEDSGKQAADTPPIKKQIKVKVYNVDLQIDGVSDEDKVCSGGYVCLNNDDDDEDGKLDLKQTSVAGENDLHKITLIKDPKDGKVTLSVTKGVGKIKVWEKPTKEKEVKLPATFDASELPKTLWVEGVEVSDELKDIELLLESDDPKCQDKGTLTVLTATIDVDTDRDGTIDHDKDEKQKDKWSKDRGAIYNVNYDRDGARAIGAKPLPDAIDFDDDGTPDDEDFKIDNAADVDDVTPFIIRKFGVLPPNAKVFLKVEDVEQIQSIHVFKERKAGETAIWGKVGSRVPGGADDPLEKEITPWIDLKKDVEFGLEGLFFRNTGSINPFSGYIPLTLELRQDGKVLCSDKVRLKVAPWMMIPNTENSSEAWAEDAGVKNETFRLNKKAEKGYVGLDNSGQLPPAQAVAPPDAGNQWFQDHLEIGYTQRPGGPKTYSVFRLPYIRSNALLPQPEWPRTKLMKKDVGMFQLGKNLGAGSGDYGGNLELMPPTPAHKLGRIVVGSIASAEFLEFLESQEVQEPEQVGTGWLAVGHVDEALAFTGSHNEVAIADPVDAYASMNKLAVAERGRAVFFAVGANPIDGKASANATTNKRIETGIDLTGKTWKYIRIYEDSGSGAAGQVARIKTLGNGFIEIDKVWLTGSKIIAGGGAANYIKQYMFKQAPSKGTWFVAPQKDDKYVLVEGTRFWVQELMGGPVYTPAIVTVAEVLRDADLEKLNKTNAQDQLDRIKKKLETAAGGAANLSFVKVPSIYVGELDHFATVRTGVAFTPGLVNVQTVNGKLYFPRQFGPRDNTGKDIFEETIKSRFTNAVFVDDWDLYHRREGEVHCGSSTKRDIPAVKWWENQP